MVSGPHLARWTDFFAYNPASRHRRRILCRLLAPLKFRTLLDVGCGDGQLLKFLKARFGCEAHGMEPEDEPAALRDGGLDGFYRMDIAREAPPGTFDVVVCSEVLEHIPEDREALKNLRKVCGRYLLVTVPAGPIRATDKFMGHVRHYSREDLEEKVRSAGFAVRRCFAWGFPWHSLYKALQDRVPDQMIRGFGNRPYGLFQKAVSHLLYAAFFLNSGRRGCQLFLLAEADGPG